MNRPTTDLAVLETVLAEIRAERGRQDAKWGEQNHPDGTGAQFANRAAYERIRTETAAADGALTFRHVLAEEVAEAYAESDPDRLRAELVQVAATAVCWIQAIDRRANRHLTRRDPWTYDGDIQSHPILNLLEETR
jgi:hypothetical protein